MKIAPMDRQRFEAKLRIAPAADGKTPAGSVAIVGRFRHSGRKPIVIRHSGQVIVRGIDEESRSAFRP